MLISKPVYSSSGEILGYASTWWDVCVMIGAPEGTSPGVEGPDGFFVREERSTK